MAITPTSENTQIRDELWKPPNAVQLVRKSILNLRSELCVVRLRLNQAKKRFDQGSWPDELCWPRNRQHLLQTSKGIPPSKLAASLNSGWCGILSGLTRHIPELWDALEKSLTALDAVHRWLSHEGASRDDRFTMRLREVIIAIEQEPFILTQPPAGSMRNLSTVLQHLRQTTRGYPPGWDGIEQQLLQPIKQMHAVGTAFDWCALTPPNGGGSSSLPAEDVSGALEIDEKKFVLRWKAQKCEFGNTLPFRIVCMLSKRFGSYCSHSEILSAAWDGQTISDSALYQAVRRANTYLRKSGIIDLTIDGSNWKHYGLVALEPSRRPLKCHRDVSRVSGQREMTLRDSG